VKGWLVSKESPPHRQRWGRVLAPYFDEFEIVLDDEDANDWVPDSDFDLVFTTNILDTSLRFQSRIRPERHIAISNSFDLMVSGAQLNREKLKNELPLVKEFWVDTTWAVNLLQDDFAEKVRYIPWGLEQFPMRTLIAQSEKTILIPRVGSSHYNPELAVATVKRLNASNLGVNFVFLGLPPSLEAAISKEVDDLKPFRFLPLLPEEDFLNLLQSMSAVLITPKTDGTSISMLQSLWLGVPVVSTPTVGAKEWLVPSATGDSRVGLDPTTLAVAVESSIREKICPRLLQTERGRILERANLEKNVRKALRSRLS
jgi:glycosyltransferase involved in cell wall biosynthesis